ncbi:MAG: hypothetical protein AB202_01630, partial [Parcubacteria bacterium C7867-007]
FLGLGSSTPWGQLSINPTNTNGSAPSFVVGSSTATQFVVTNEGRVGIGTSTPGSLLSLQGIANFTTATSTLYGTGGINLTGGGCYAINGTCVGGSNLSFTYPLINTADTISLAFGTTTANTWSAANNFTSTVALSSTTPWAQLSINPTDANGSAPSFVIGSSTATQFVVTNAGNIGIGTSTPGSLLSIQGIANFTTATSTLYGTGGINISAGCYAVNGTCLTNFSNTLANGGTATTTFYDGGLVFSDGNKLTQAANSGASILKWDNTNGRLGIGTTTPNWLLSVSGAAGVRFKTTSNVSDAFVVENSIGSSSLSFSTIDSADAIFSVATTSGSTYFYIGASGSVGIGTTTPTTQLVSTGGVRFATFGAGTLQTDSLGNLSVSSDERLKDINGTFTRGLAEIRGLNPILYHWNATSTLDRSTLYAGFSAQNVQGVIPEAVDMGPQGYLSLSDRPILAASVNAIKDLASQMDLLSISTSTLASRISDIEDSLEGTGDPVAIDVSDINATSLNVSGNALATTFIAPATPITFTIASTTGVLPEEILVSGGVDLYKAATYAITGVQSLSAQTALLANRIDAVELRVTMLEAIASSTPSSGGTLTLAAFKGLLEQAGIFIQDGIARFGSLAFTNLIAAPAADGTSSVATSTIAVGETEMVVSNPFTRPSSKIFVTITSPLSGSWYIREKTEGSFTIALSSVQDQDVTFDYFIVQTEGQSQLASAGAPIVVPPPAPAPTPDSPAPEPTPPAPGAPTITLNGDAAVDIAQGAYWADPGATASDATGTDLTSEIVVTGTVDTNTAGLYTLNYSVVDGVGQSAGVSRIVHVAAPGLGAPPEPTPTPEPTPEPAPEPEIIPAPEPTPEPVPIASSAP